MSALRGARLLWTCALPAFILAACSDGNSPEAPPKDITPSAGTGQSAVVGSALSQSLSVKVTNTNNQPSAGQTVTWSVTAGNGSVTPATSTSDANGVATARWTLGTGAGQQTVTATVSGLPAAVFTATALPGPATRVQAQFVGSPVGFVAGDSIRIQANSVDQYGNLNPLDAFTYRSSNPAVATVSASGVVRAVAPGTATITVSVGSLSATLDITVGTASCTADNTLSLSVGQTREFAGPAGSQICVSGGAGSEYTLIPFFNDPSGTAALTLTVSSPNVTDVTGPPSPVVFSRGGIAEPVLQRDEAFERRLREREVTELLGLVPAAREWQKQQQAQQRQRPAYSVAAAPPQVGDLMQLNANANSGCSSPITKTARVVAISNGAIVVADTTNPAAFTTADYQSFATDFDTLVNPVDTTNFGQPTDIDNNGKVIIFFTIEVNKLTPAGSSSYIGGFFFGRDLFPKTNTARLGACPASNAAEMFYIIAPDPNGQFNNVRTTAFVKPIVTGIIAHEYQHLINYSRRLYVTQVDQSNLEETVWLNEGLSHIAEELTFYGSGSGFKPRQNITIDAIRASTVALNTLNMYEASNLSRLSSYLRAPESNSPIAPNDNLGTRGATWSFLRYAADRKGGDEKAFWRALVRDATGIGLNNLQNALGTDPMPWIQNWTTATYVDDAVSGTPSQFNMPSWNFRSMLPALSSNSGKFPLKVTTLSPTATTTVSITGGSAAYLRFGVAASGTARLATTANVSGRTESPPSTLVMTLVRTK